MEIKSVRERLQVNDADLTQSSFVNVALPRSSFTDVNLSAAVFADVNLSNVSITEANLTGMRINGVLVSDLFQAYESRGK